MAIGEITTLVDGSKYRQVGEDAYQLVTETEQTGQAQAPQQIENKFNEIVTLKDGTQYRRVGEDAYQLVTEEEKEQEDQTTVGQYATGLAADIGISSAFQAAGTALAVPTGGISYPVFSFVGGVLGDLASQEIEGAEEYSFGRALIGGIANLLPGGKAIKNAERAAEKTGRMLSRGEKIAIAAKEQAVRGAAIGASQQAAIAVIDEGRPPEFDDMLKGAGFGAVIGGGLGGGMQAAFGKFAGKLPSVIDKQISSGEITGSDVANTISVKPDLNDLAKAGDIVNKVKESVEQEDAKRLMQTLAGTQDLGGFQRLVNVFTPTRVLGDDVSNAIFYGNKEVHAMKVIGSRLNQSITKQIGDDKRLFDLANEAIATNKIPESLEGTRLAGDLAEFFRLRSNIEKMGLKQLKTEKFSNLTTNEQKSLIKTLESHITGEEGSYQANRYRIFDDVKYVVNEKDKKAAIDELTEGLIEKQKARNEEIRIKNAEHKLKLEDNVARIRNSDLPEEELSTLKQEFVKLSKEKVGKETKLTPKNQARIRAAATKHINSLQANSAKNKAEAGAVSQTGIPSKTRYTFRTDPGPAVKRFLGEITEPGEIIARTLDSQTKIIIRNQNDINIANALQKAGLAFKPKANEVIPDHLSKLKLIGTVDTGLFVPNEVQYALGQTYLSGVDKKINNVVLETFDDLWTNLVGSSKAVKVLLNPPSYATNAFGGATMLLAQGINPFSKSFAKGAKIASAEFKTIDQFLGGNDAASRALFIKEYEDAVKYGVTSGNVIASDIIEGFKKGYFSETTKKLFDPFAKAYQITDVAFRYAAWKTNTDKVRKFFPTITDEQAKKAGAAWTNMTYQNYEMLSPILRTFSQKGLMPQFVAFTAEFMRNIWHQGRLAKHMMAGTLGKELGIASDVVNTKAMKAEGVKRASTLLAVTAGAETARQYMNAEAGVDPEKEKVLKESVLPEWDKQKSLLFSKDKDGNLSYQNMSYIIPHTLFAEAFNAGISDQPLSNLTNMFVDNFVGEGSFVVGAAIKSIENVDKGIISTETAKSMENYKDRIAFFANEAFRPGFAREYDKLISAMEGKEGQTVPDVIKRQFGMRVYPIKQDLSVSIRLKDTVERAKLAKGEYTKSVKRGDTPREIEESYRNADQTRQRIFGELFQHYNNLEKLGYSEDESIKKLKDAGLSTKDTIAMIDGKYASIERDVSKKDDGYEEITGTKEEKLSQIKSIYKTDPVTAKKYLSKLKQEIKDERLNLTAKEKLFRNSSIENRVDYIMQNPQVFHYLRKKGLISKNVMLELKQRKFIIPRS